MQLLDLMIVRAVTISLYLIETLILRCSYCRCQSGFMSIDAFLKSLKEHYGKKNERENIVVTQNNENLKVIAIHPWTLQNQR